MKHSTQTPGSRQISRRTVLLAGAGGLAATLTGTAAWALDRYVIDHVEISNVSAYEAANSAATTAATSLAADSELSITDTSYTSPTSAVTIATHTSGSGDDTITWYTAELKLQDPTALRSAFANNEFGTNITARPSEIASQNNAILAFNGDYYGFRDDGILIRNGVIYRDSGVRDGMVFYRDGSAAVYDETSTNAKTLLADGAWNTVSFGPALVKDGAVISGIDQVEVDTNVGNHSIQGNQPRTALGYIDTGHYLLVVVDGRNTGYSRGMTLPELAQTLVDAGCQCGYNLDGGGSSAMYFNGQIINQPSNGGERATSDILYLTKGA